MADLTKEFFERDLSEIEGESLAREIESSPEAAMRLAESARLAYEATGLSMPPETKIPGSDGHAVMARVLLTALGTVITLAVYIVWRCAMQVPDQAVPSTTAPAPPVPPSLHSTKPFSKPTVRRSVSAFITPQAATEGEAYEALDVLVKRAKAGAVTIKILDGKGATVRNLYAGPVSQGYWRFPWNGRLDGGALVDEGPYRIEVGTEAGTQYRAVRISDETKPPPAKP